MNRRPLAIAVLGWLFIATGTLALLYHLSEFSSQHPFNKELIWVCVVRVLAVIGGAFLLRGHNWARWLLTAWMAFHIVLSIFHSPVELVMHILLFGTIGYFLFRPQSSAYFQRSRVEPPQTPKNNDAAVAR
jgi:hypothetical protein